MGRLGDLGGTGGGTLLDEPEGRSQRTAGMFNVSGCGCIVFADRSSRFGELVKTVGLSTRVDGPTVAVDTTESVTSVVSPETTPESSRVELLKALTGEEVGKTFTPRVSTPIAAAPRS